MPIAQHDLTCPDCAGQCVFSPSDGALCCKSCGNLQAIHQDPDADPTREFHYDPDTPHTEQSVWNRVITHQCETCGGAVTFEGPALSERCSYCDGPVVLKESDTNYEAIGLIPFRKVLGDALGNARVWASKRIAAPDDLSEAIKAGRTTGLYAPFWTFDSNEAVDYFMIYRVKRGKKWSIRTKSDFMGLQFDDLLMPASPHVTPLIRDGILHDFRPSDLRVYDPAFLAGFGAEQHHQSVTEGLEANRKDKDVLIRNQIKKHSGKRNIVSISYKTHTTGIHYRRILLPVWICHYTYADQPYKVVTSGIDGRTYGERPFSTRKLMQFSAAISIVLLSLGWLWGMSTTL